MRFDWIKNQKEKALHILTFALAALTFLYIFTNYSLSFHADSAAVNILAREQMRTREFFPDTWNSATGIWLVFYNLFIIPLSIFTKNQLVLRSLAVAITVLGIILLLRYFSRKLLHSGFYLISLCFLFSGTSLMVNEMSFSQAAYLPFLWDSLLLLLLFVKSVSDRFCVKNKIQFGFLLLDLGYLCLYGILNLAYYVIPFLGALVLFFLLDYAQASMEQSKEVLVGMVKVFAMFVAAIVLGLIGYRILSSSLGFVSSANGTYPSDSNMLDSFVGFVLSAIGYRTSVPIFSLRGIMNVVIVFGFVAMIVCCVLLFRKYYEQPFEVKILMNFLLMVFVICVYFDFTIYGSDISANRYFYRPLCCVYLLSGYYIYTYIFQKGIIVKTVSLLAIALFSLPYMLAGLPTSIRYPQLHASQTAVADYLRDNGLKQGYASFWNAGKHMVLSDFEVEIGGVLFNGLIEPYYWLSSDMTYDSDLYQGESFLMLTNSEDEALKDYVGKARLGEPSRVLSYEGYHIYVYPYNIAENNFRGRGFSNMEMLHQMVVSNEEMRQSDGDILINSGEIVYGPYLALPNGQYRIDVEFSEMRSPVDFRLTSDGGQTLIKEGSIEESMDSVFFEISDDVENFEMVLMTDGAAVLHSIKLTGVQ